MRVWWVLGVAAGCGAGLAPAVLVAPVARAGVPPATEEAALRKQMTGTVINGGLWFADAECQAQFGTPGPLAHDSFDAFAHCLAGLHLRPTGRADSIDDTSVLTDDAGFEIEARVTDRYLASIGFSSGTAAPSITPAALEALRTSGDPKAPITAKGPAADVYMRLCLDETGAVRSLLPAATTTPAAATAATTLAKSWAFRPFTVGETPMAACAIVAFHDAGEHGADRLPHPKLSKAGHVIYNVDPVELEALRTAGTRRIVPDEHDKIAYGHKRLNGSFEVCFDEAGTFERGVVLGSTGAKRYDARIERELASWAFRPFLVGGVAAPVCTAVTFIYSQD